MSRKRNAGGPPRETDGRRRGLFSNRLKSRTNVGRGRAQVVCVCVGGGGGRRTPLSSAVINVYGFFTRLHVSSYSNSYVLLGNYRSERDDFFSRRSRVLYAFIAFRSKRVAFISVRVVLQVMPIEIRIRV